MRSIQPLNWDWFRHRKVSITRICSSSICTSIVAYVVLKKKWNLWKVLIALDVMVVLYYAGILALYLFSMPLDEAIRLAGFERYASSIVVLFAGGLVLCRC
ncbi:hypothetical protein EHV15_30140 [Paenibacillus oralis]|uniref:Uncharacterized protein n=1 Tax=Paenibacillus oralis TaxID=2490856 RepID=A0A3P3U8N6_9BACL|nr:hypothetical protein [Paenibacillus oralis]RRJ66717.1 hypothetical protein EHV15_30140 [Paenibacillus oralis]